MQEFTKWEYRTEYGDYDEAKLNEWGNDGWELVTVIPGEPGKHTYFFKRPKRY
jgi:hypothetical protein